MSVWGSLQAVKLYDALGNALKIVQDGSDYLLGVAAKAAKDSSGLVHLEAVDVETGVGRLKATLYTPEGEVVAFGSVPADPTSIKNDFVKNAGSPSLLVDGSSTPVVFTYDADSTYDISLQELKFVLASNSITFGNDYFGATSGPLTNGLLVEVVSNGNTGTVYNLTQNECFVHLASPGGFQWVVSSKDMMSSAWLIGGGLKLVHGTSDKVRITVRDNISSAGVYFRCCVKGNLLAA
jgi:hypothetical protein